MVVGIPRRFHLPAMPAAPDAGDGARRIAELVDRIGADVLGDRIRRLRTGMGLSIRDVAAAAKLSKTSLVRLEQGQKCRPATIANVCTVLGVHVERLGDSDRGAVAAVHRRGDDRWFDMSDVSAKPLRVPKGARVPAKHSAAVAVDLLRSRLANGRVLPTILDVHRESETRSHPGEEFVYVLSGRLHLTVGTQHFELARGESICFFSGEPHRYAPVGRTPARVLSVRVDG